LIDLQLLGESGKRKAGMQMWSKINDINNEKQNERTKT